VASARDIAALIKKLRDEGKTILVVTHQAAHVAGVADYSLLFSQGQLLRCEAGIGAATDGGSTRASRNEGAAP
jgi:energy-coupling factor transporter ATP-binding protein EcfA2